MGGNELLEQIKAMLLEEYSVSQWVLLFFLYSFCGWCWEVFLYLVKERRFVNRGFLFGPILPIYGFGAVGTQAGNSCHEAVAESTHHQ